MKFIRCYLLIIVLIFLCGCGSALRVYLHPQTDIGGIKKVAVVPFSNFSADHFAGERVTNAFITELLIRTNVEIVEEGEPATWIARGYQVFEKGHLALSPGYE